MPSPLESASEAHLLTKTFKHLDPSDKLRFSCDWCGWCCMNTAVLLNSYDLLVLRRYMRTTTTELLDRQVIELFFSPTSGLPGCGFSFQAVSKDEEFCPFLMPIHDPSVPFAPFEWAGWEKSRDSVLKAQPETKSQRLLGCQVHAGRPTVCRSYPLGRALVTDYKDDSQEAEIVLQDPDSFCKGHQTDTETTVSDWLEESRCWQYWEANDVFVRIMVHLEAAGFDACHSGTDTCHSEAAAEESTSPPPDPSIPQDDTTPRDDITRLDGASLHPSPSGVADAGQKPWPEDLFRLVFAALYEFDEAPFLEQEFPSSAVHGDHATDMRTLLRIGEIIDLIIELKKRLDKGNEDEALRLRDLVVSLVGEP